MNNGRHITPCVARNITRNNVVHITYALAYISRMRSIPYHDCRAVHNKKALSLRRNRKKQFEYCLVTAPITHPIKKWPEIARISGHLPFLYRLFLSGRTTRRLSLVSHRFSFWIILAQKRCFALRIKSFKVFAYLKLFRGLNSQWLSPLSYSAL